MWCVHPVAALQQIGPFVEDNIGESEHGTSDLALLRGKAMRPGCNQCWQVAFLEQC